MQYTSINGTTSSLQSIQMGIPQESTLGPFLFLIFMNDLPLASSFKTTLFVDDPMLTLCSTNLINLERTANLELTKIQNWLKFNKLSLNVTKTTYLLIKNKLKTQTNQFSLQTDGAPLLKSNAVKYLGVYIDDQLNWAQHI